MGKMRLLTKYIAIFLVAAAVFAGLYFAVDYALRGPRIVIQGERIRTKDKEINLAGKKLSGDDLACLARMTDPERLDLSNTQISDISMLGGFTGLKWLNLGDNQIEDISALSELVSLEELLLYHNHISGISQLTPLTGLKTLNLGSNEITDISPLYSLSGLLRLNLSQNQIVDIFTILYMPILIELDLTGNPVSTDWIPVSHVYSVYGKPYGNYNDYITIRGIDINLFDSYLYLANLGITDPELVFLKYMTNLNGLDLSGNQISDISPLADITGLKGLDLSGNRIGDISPLSEITGLETLFLNDNQISDITVLAGLNELKWLDLSNNPVTGWSSVSHVEAVIGRP